MTRNKQVRTRLAVYLGLSLLMIPFVSCRSSSAPAEQTSETSFSLLESVQGEASEDVALKGQYYIDPDLWLVRSIQGGQHKKLALLTFDNVPNGSALDIATALESKGLRGLFFVNGNKLSQESDRKIIQKLYERGHSIGCNGRTGANLSGVDESLQRKEIEDNIKQIETITGARPRFFRPQQGDADQKTLDICAENNLIYMEWSFGYDWMDGYQNKDSLTNAILQESPLKDGVNLLFHDLPWTAEAIPGIVDGLQAKDFLIVNPSEIAKAPSSVAAPNKRQEIVGEDVTTAQNETSENTSQASQ